VGIENTIITGIIYDEIMGKTKFIPIIRGDTKEIKDNLPSYLKSRYSIDFRDDSQYKLKFDELIRKIFDVPKYKRPQLGQAPNLTSKDV
jgi:hypothetical protein